MTRLQEAWLPGAQANVILNDDPESDFKHIELEEERIRLEFQSTESPVYQGYARAWAGMQMDGDRSNGGLENAVVDIKNNTFCGAGATVFLCRERSRSTWRGGIFEWWFSTTSAAARSRRGEWQRL